MRDAVDAVAWASAFRDRVASYDGLYAFAAGVYGAPEQCSAAITMHFDGVAFGLLTLTFAGGETLVVETMPPQVGIIELRVPSGFADEQAARAALRAYTAARGLMIDWSTPETATASGTAAREGETTRTFRDPDPGLNGSAALVFDRERLVAVRVAMAP